jgi:hypothetical protein
MTGKSDHRLQIKTPQPTARFIGQFLTFYGHIWSDVILLTG